MLLAAIPVRMPLCIRNPDTFVAGNIHACFPAWESITKIAPFKLTPNILRWIQDCVDVREFFQPFKGQHKGESFNSALPPRRIFHNAISCKPFAQFISDTIVNRLSSGANSLWGKVGDVPPPYLVMPLTIEPSKPRLCNDNRFLNLWIRDVPFKLDSLMGLPRYVFPSSFQSVCDDKSGYDHVLLSPESRPYFGFERGGWYFASNTIPFGWKASAYTYHLPLIISVPSVYLAPYILMILIRAKSSCLLRPLATPPSRWIWTNLKLVPIGLFFWSVLLLLIWVISLVSRNLSSSQGKLFHSLGFWLTLFANPFCLLRRKTRNSFPFCVLFLTPMLLM